MSKLDPRMTIGAVARFARQFLFAAAAIMALCVFLSSHARAQTEESPEDYPAGANRDEAFYACSACHGFKLVSQQGMNRRQWNESIDLMVSKHNMPKPDDDEREKILDYLESAFPQRTTPNRGGFQNPFIK